MPSSQSSWSFWGDERCVEAAVSGSFNKKLADAGAPREGHVAFAFNDTVAFGNPPSVRVRSTKQWLKDKDLVSLWRLREQKRNKFDVQ